YMANSCYSAMEIGDEVGCQRNARITRASRVEIHNAIDAWIAGMLLILDAVCEYQIVRTESKNVGRLPTKGMLALQGLQESTFITQLMLELQECS
ncbi:hypothetical protein Tco_1051138, partial [Tanacetum coccineum]